MLRTIINLQLFALGFIAVLLSGRFLGALGPGLGWTLFVALPAIAGPVGLAVRMLATRSEGNDAALSWTVGVAFAYGGLLIWNNLEGPRDSPLVLFIGFGLLWALGAFGIGAASASLFGVPFNLSLDEE